jgi:hypothetical protein
VTISSVPATFNHTAGPPIVTKIPLFKALSLAAGLGLGMLSYPVHAAPASSGDTSQYLDIVHSQGREPDVWERLSLNDALRILNRGEVHYAASYFRHAITPPDNQSKDYPIDTETAATVAPLDLNYFRRAVRWLRDRGFQRPL